MRIRLRSERRGCLQLPNVDYCFQNANVEVVVGDKQ